MAPRWLVFLVIGTSVATAVRHRLEEPTVPGRTDTAVICDYLLYREPGGPARRPVVDSSGATVETGYCDFLWVEEIWELEGKIWLQGVIYTGRPTVGWVTADVVRPEAAKPTSLLCGDGNERFGSPPKPCPEDVILARANAGRISWEEANAQAARLGLPGR
jgi:hypothetical protein